MLYIQPPEPGSPSLLGGGEGGGPCLRREVAGRALVPWIVLLVRHFLGNADRNVAEEALRMPSISTHPWGR